jgi:hypothetical protein
MHNPTPIHDNHVRGSVRDFWACSFWENPPGRITVFSEGGGD